jgi:pyoverdine/dityrosine biosynthesis protein Dit1
MVYLLYSGWLLDAEDAWTTPWHSAVVHWADDSWELMRRSDAERLGHLGLHDGRPSHFEPGSARLARRLAMRPLLLGMTRAGGQGFGRLTEAGW